MSPQWPGQLRHRRAAALTMRIHREMERARAVPGYTPLATGGTELVDRATVSTPGGQQGGYRRAVRARVFVQPQTKGRIMGDPRVGFAYALRARLSAPAIAPARLIDPKTGDIRGYMDPVSRRVFQDEALTQPVACTPRA